MGKQQISLEAPIQKTANGFNSKNVRIKIDNTLPEVGAVTWYATGQMAHTWLEHRSEFSNIEINGSDEARLFKANFSIPKGAQFPRMPEDYAQPFGSYEVGCSAQTN